MNANENQDIPKKWQHFAQNLLSESRIEKTPVSGTFELTPRCNLKCKMCYIRLTKEQMDLIGRERTAEEWIKMGRQAADAGTLFLLLTGGEPFLRPDFREIYEALSEMGFLITIYSNGTLIDEQTVQWLAKTPPATIKITMYGASNDTYEKVCGISDGFDRMKSAVRLLKAAGINVYCGTTIIQENLHDAPLMEQVAKDLEVYIAHNPNVVGEVRGASWDAKPSRLSAEQFGEFIKRDNVRVEALCNTEGTFDSKCGKVNCGYWITWDGKMNVCVFLSKPSSYPFDSGFLPAWLTLNNAVLNIKEPEKCSGCRYKAFCYNCPGLLNAESGSYIETSDRICELAKVFYSQYSFHFAELAE